MALRPSIQENRRQPTHIRLVANAEEARLAGIPLQQPQHRADCIVCTQHGGFFYLPGELQGVRHNVGRLPRPHQRTTEEMIERPQDGC